MKSHLTILIIFCLTFSSVSAQNDSSKESFVPFIDLLEVGEQYEITIKSIGCFHNRKQSLFVSREENTFVAVLNDTQLTLNKSQIAALRKFERQLKYAYDSGGCTTVDTYVLKYGTEEKVYNDGSCSRFYGRVLLEELGLSS